MDPKVVYCITCKNRTQHLRETLPRNLRDNPGAQFVLLDYGSQDDLGEYIHASHEDALRSGHLVVYHYANGGPFRVAHAKNMAFRCGILEGVDILVTLDADNSTGPGFTEFILDKFREPGIVPGIFLCPDFPLIHSMPHGPPRPNRGYAGRLAVWSQDFIKAGGYNEIFDVWGSEDIDLIYRLQRMGYQIRPIPNHFLNAIPHNAEVRFREYPEAKQFENPKHVRSLEFRTETVVNNGNIGCGTVFRDGDFHPIDLSPLPTRIFGIGLHKTGTSSLHRAFQTLGLSSFHWGTGEAPIIWQEMKRLGRSPMLERWYALSDLPIPLLYQQLDRAYPGSKFILTIRNEGEWVDSVRRLWDPRYNPTRWVWDVYPFTNTIHTVLYGQRDFDAEVFLARYRRHNAEVMDYFRGRPEDLLVFNISEGDGWSELCGFLGYPWPDCPYPCENRRRDPIGGPAYSTCSGDE